MTLASRATLGALVLLTILSVTQPVAAQTAFEAATRGASCRQNTQGERLCIYRIGRDLEFSITAVGESDAGVSFLRSNITGDFFARTGVQHPCVIVAAGERAPAEARTPAGGYAFVSPFTGLVYRTWQACADDRPMRR
jgi:hypothetical protein